MPIAIERKIDTSMMNSPASAIITARPLKNTARPAVALAISMASSLPRPRRRSDRKRVIMNSESSTETASPMRMISCVAYGLTGATVWLNTPKIPNAASRAVIARTSGTIAATNAPNVSSRMMNVSPIVANVVSRLLLMRVVMSSLVRVELRVWTSKPLAAPSASIAAIAGRTGTRS